LHGFTDVTTVIWTYGLFYVSAVLLSPAIARNLGSLKNAMGRSAMFLSKLCPRPSLGAVGAVTGCLALFFAVGGGELVFAHGGDATKIHACVTDTTGQIQIIADPTGYGDPSGACPAQTHALDWNGTGVTGPAGPPGPSAPPVPPTPADTAGGIAERLPPGRKVSKLSGGKVKLVYSGVGSSESAAKGAKVQCPASHPEVLEGGAMASAYFPPAYFEGSVLYAGGDVPWPVEWVYNHALVHGWTAYALRDDAGAKALWGPYEWIKAWRLTVWARCSVKSKGLVHHKP
jgi:hypothetical protein